ncbi:MAG TPA: antibiotic biosynthesis monooxygenase [Nocardioidaceae bacterium]|nr:antibiotic biosynthesis monooxygenase [Nocardioidaceae bacterium]
MPGQILTEVSATVHPTREAELVAAFRELGNAPLPDGLLRTELVRGHEGRWRIQTYWRDHASLDALLALPEPPPARRLFQDVGAEPSLQILKVEADHVAAAAE